MDKVNSEPDDSNKQVQISHKVIEKRRRDRINTCLSELSQTVPAAFSKQTSGKLEKAEILEMTVDYLKAIQATEVGIRIENGDWYSLSIWTDFMHHYRVGYNDCIREILRYMTDVEGLCSNDDRCIRMKTYLETKFKPDGSLSGGQAYIHNINKCNIVQRDWFHNTDRSSQSLRFQPYVSSQNGTQDVRLLRFSERPHNMIIKSSSTMDILPPFLSSYTSLPGVTERRVMHTYTKLPF